MAVQENELQLKLLGDSGELKLFQATSRSESILSNHISTGDAVIIVEEGSAVLVMDGNEQVLKKGDFAIVRKNKEHSLKAQPDFRAKIAMSNNAEIEPK